MAKEHRFSRLRRLTAEGLVVILSILIAFWLDAWWERRQDQSDIALALDNVRQELRSNRERVSNELELLDRLMGANAATLQLLESSPAARRVAIPDTLAWFTTSWAPTLSVSYGATDALIASGRLAEVRDQELREGLAGLRDRVADAAEDELVARQLGVELQAPLLAGSLDLSVFDRLEDQFVWGGAEMAAPAPSYGSVEFPADLPVRNSIRLRLQWYSSARDEMQGLVEHLDRLLALAGGTP